MLKWVKRIALVLAITFLTLTVINASWLAAAPTGYVKLLAHRGTMQQFSHKSLKSEDCTATRIEPPVHDFLENTVPGLLMADGLGAYMIEVDVAPTADGRIALFHDRALNCRTNGSGEVRGATLAQLKALDAGYGYSADGGKTFPLRGKLGYIPSLEDALIAVPAVPLLYNLKGKDPREAELLIAALKAAGRDVVKIGDAFSAPENELAAIRTAFPGVWAYSAAGIKACTKAYLLSGWFAVTPEVCRGGTIAVPLNYQWAFAGWPDKLQARMASVDGHVILIGPYRSGQAPIGLDLPEQIGQIPSTFTGTVWVDDIWVIGPALHPAANHRNAREEAETAAMLAARRKARD
jgi:glycerophosphoryl diester phosphodiesterase